jgi:hypothetical protein
LTSSRQSAPIAIPAKRRRPGHGALMVTMPILLSLCLFPIAAATAPPVLIIRDTIGKEWRDEPICWELDLARDQWAGGEVLVERDGKAIAAQATVVSKHDDGTAKRVEIRFFIDELAKGGSTELVCHIGKAGPRNSDLRIAREVGALVLSSGHAAVKLLDRNVESADGGESPTCSSSRPPRQSSSRTRSRTTSASRSSRGSPTAAASPSARSKSWPASRGKEAGGSSWWPSRARPTSRRPT